MVIWGGPVRVGTGCAAYGAPFRCRGWPYPACRPSRPSPAKRSAPFDRSPGVGRGPRSRRPRPSRVRLRLLCSARPSPVGSAGRSIDGASQTVAAIAGAGSTGSASRISAIGVGSAGGTASCSGVVAASQWESDVTSACAADPSDVLSGAWTASGTEPESPTCSVSGFAAARGRGDLRRGVGVDTGANSTVSSTVNRFPSMSTHLHLQLRT